MAARSLLRTVAVVLMALALAVAVALSFRSGWSGWPLGQPRLLDARAWLIGAGLALGRLVLLVLGLVVAGWILARAARSPDSRTTPGHRKGHPNGARPSAG